VKDPDSPGGVRIRILAKIPQAPISGRIEQVDRRAFHKGKVAGAGSPFQAEGLAKVTNLVPSRILRTTQRSINISRNDLSRRQVDFRHVAAVVSEIAFGSDTRPAQADDISQVAECRLVRGTLSAPDGIRVDSTS
jgi:hypothetical protein